MIYWYSLRIIFFVNLIVTASVFVLMFVRTIESCLPHGFLTFVITSHSPVCFFYFLTFHGFCSPSLLSAHVYHGFSPLFFHPFGIVLFHLTQLLFSFPPFVMASDHNSLFVMASVLRLTVCHGFCSPFQCLSYLSS